MDGPFRALMGEIAEILSASASPASAWTSIMISLERAIGFDSGFIATTAGPMHSSQGALLCHDEVLIRQSIGAYLRRITPVEISRYLNRSRRDDEVWTQSRRDQLAANYARLAPQVARHMLVRVSLREGRLLGINLERARPFTEHELALIDAVAPLVQLVDLIASSGSAEPDLVGLWGLTRREAEVAALVLRGLQNGEAARILGLSVNTVRNTLARAFAKAGVTTRSELVFLAHQLAGTHGSGGGSATCSDGVHEFAKLVRHVGTSASGPPLGAPAPRVGLIYSAPRP